MCPEDINENRIPFRVYTQVKLDFSDITELEYSERKVKLGEKFGNRLGKRIRKHVWKREQMTKVDKRESRRRRQREREREMAAYSSHSRH